MLKPFKLFIHATNIHQGGGRALLDALIQAIPSEQETLLNLDERMPISNGLGPNVSVKRSSPTVVHRWLAEKWLADNATKEDVVLCLGNLQPLFRLRAYTVVFVQNRYLIDDVKMQGFTRRTRLRLTAERLWFSVRMANADEFVVQTPTMKCLLEGKITGRVPVRTMPFVETPLGYMRELGSPQRRTDSEFDFAYVATGEPHKNHRRLIDAWCLLAEEMLYPTLCVTLDSVRYCALCADIESMIPLKGIKVINMGELPHTDVLKLYASVGALIYPSVFESFGLPLIEARQAGLPILASELDYVRDVVDPEQSFNPESPRSIAAAVKRFLGITEPGLALLDAQEFISCVMERREV